jgi:cytidylate kinase
MEKQIIISICREHGSAGHEIATLLAKKLDVPVYDKNIFEEIGKTKGIDTNDISKYDEKPRRFFITRKVNGHSNSPEENVAELQFALLKSKAADGDSFVVVGRCADQLFRGMDGAISIFITGNMKEKVAHIMKSENRTEADAKKEIEKHDKRRRQYHDYFFPNSKWADSRSYDICVNSSLLGLEGTVEFLYDFINKFRIRNSEFRG